jgi:hypothetical protein
MRKKGDPVARCSLSDCADPTPAGEELPASHPLFPAQIVAAALVFLLDAQEAAGKPGSSTWGVAREAGALGGADAEPRAHGESRVRGLPVQRRGTASVRARQRSFRCVRYLGLNGHGCVVLAAARVAARRGAGAAPAAPGWGANGLHPNRGDWAVKCFRRVAPNRETVLATFEEEGWPARIDDPLPCANGCEPRECLHDTINGLNRGLRGRTLCSGATERDAGSGGPSSPIFPRSPLTPLAHRFDGRLACGRGVREAEWPEEAEAHALRPAAVAP